MVKVPLYIRNQNQNIKENLKMIRNMVKVFTLKKIQNTKENLLMTLCMDMDFYKYILKKKFIINLLIQKNIVAQYNG